jgi:hypothetical protein
MSVENQVSQQQRQIADLFQKFDNLSAIRRGASQAEVDDLRAWLIDLQKSIDSLREEVRRGPPVYGPPRREEPEMTSLEKLGVTKWL